jgi:hypothetical protein
MVRAVISLETVSDGYDGHATPGDLTVRLRPRPMPWSLIGDP